MTANDGDSPAMIRSAITVQERGPVRISRSVYSITIDWSYLEGMWGEVLNLRSAQGTYYVIYPMNYEGIRRVPGIDRQHILPLLQFLSEMTIDYS